MLFEGCTVRDATYKYVHEMNAIDQGMIAKCMEADPWDWKEVTVRGEDEEPDGDLPMWYTMWSFGDSADDYWLEEMDGIRIMSELGFRIYHSDEFGYFFGIDGAGYDFYEAHWIPLYKARGLQWHDPKTEKEDEHV